MNAPRSDSSVWAASGMSLRHAETDAELQACFPVMRALRPDLPDADFFLDRVRRQQPQGYRILAAWRTGRPVGLAGYRLQDNLVHGHFLYVDDLVVLERERGAKVGECLLGRLQADARALGCRRLVLDTALGNALAQRFYFRQGLLARGMHFGMDLG